jgi:hypothetical protein
MTDGTPDSKPAPPEKKRTRNMGELALARVVEAQNGSGYAVVEDTPAFASTKQVEDYIRTNDFDGEMLAILRIVKTVKVEQQVKRVTSLSEV